MQIFLSQIALINHLPLIYTLKEAINKRQRWFLSLLVFLLS